VLAREELRRTAIAESQDARRAPVEMQLHGLFVGIDRGLTPRARIHVAVPDHEAVFRLKYLAVGIAGQLDDFHRLADC